MTITIDEPKGALWLRLPQAAQKSVAEKALNALLNGRLYPTGIDQLELAIDLAEAGVDAETISTLTRLESSLFESFMAK